MNQNEIFPLPTNLPAPVDDDAARHLIGMEFPDLQLASTSGRFVHPGKVNSRRTVLYCYPMTGVPGIPLPAGWDAIPGARGCTPQACSFRDQYQVLLAKGVALLGLSTQSTDYQKEMAERLHLPFEILSDSEFRLCDALQLPTFHVEGRRLVKRLTLIIRENRIEHLFYPVFPPDQAAAQVVTWLETH